MVKQTSKRALAIAEESGKAGLQRNKVLKFLHTHRRKQGWTRQEIGFRLDLPINVITARCNELLDAGIEVFDKKVCTVTASLVEALRATT